MSQRRINWIRRLQSALSKRPNEEECLHMAFVAWSRLKELGWNDIIYCPKDGTHFDSISAGSTGIHETWYDGEWPSGSWWCWDGGDTWPAHPTMFRLREEEPFK